METLPATVDRPRAATLASGNKGPTAIPWNVQRSLVNSAMGGAAIANNAQYHRTPNALRRELIERVDLSVSRRN